MYNQHCAASDAPSLIMANIQRRSVSFSEPVEVAAVISDAGEWHTAQDRRRFRLDTVREAHRLGPHTFEPPFNAALLAFKLGDSQESFTQVSLALDCYPEHADSAELLATLKAQFT